MRTFSYETDWWYDSPEGDEYEVPFLRQIEPPCDEAPRGETYVLQSDLAHLVTVEREAIAAYLYGHAEEARDNATRAALFWAAEHIESGDHLAQEVWTPEEIDGVGRLGASVFEQALVDQLAQETPPKKEE